MSSKNRWFMRPRIAIAIFVVIAGLTVFVSGQQRGQMANPQSSMHVPILTLGPQGPALEHVAEDWTYRHLVFSNPGTEDEAVTSGNYETWRRIVNDPRYIMQQVRRRAPAQGPFADEVARINELARANAAAGTGAAGAQPELNDAGFRFGELAMPKPAPKKSNAIHKDWSEPLGTTTAPANTVYPAKWSFSSTTASCANDFVIFPTGQAGASGRASIIAYYELYSGCGTTVPTPDWAYNTNGGTISLSPVFSSAGSQVAFIQTSTSVASLVLLSYPLTPPGTGTLTGPTGLTTTARTVSSGVHTSSGSTTLTCASGNFSATEVGASISGTNIAPGTTVAGYTSSTTITLSLNATGSSTNGNFTIGDFTSTVVSPANYSSCTAPCMTSITLNAPVTATTAPNDTISNPWYDWTSDTVYVGDDNGILHRFHPVFGGTPAEVTSGGWPLTLGSTSVSSPVYDGTSGCVYVGDTVTVSGTTTTGGRFYRVDPGLGYGSVCDVDSSATSYPSLQPAQLDGAYGIRDAPLVDSTAKRVYVFVGCDTIYSSSNTSGCGNGTSSWTGNSSVYQFTTDFTSIVERQFGDGADNTKTTAYQFAGTFDNTYYSSSTPSSPSGNLYVCSTDDQAVLWQVPISSNSTQPPVKGPNLAPSGTYGRCSPLSENFSTSSSATATGSVTIQTDPKGWATGNTVTIGSTVYTFVTSLSAANQVLEYTSGTVASDEAGTAQNLRAVIDALSTECYTSGCVHSGQTANGSVNTSYTSGSNVVNLTAKTAGTAFVLSTNYSTGINLSGGSTGGSTGTDYLFVSVYDGLPTGCTQSSGTTYYGCVMSFNITTASSFGTSLAPLGELNFNSLQYAPPTGAMIVDNALATPTGTSQIYFLTQDATGTTTCSGICGVQASQAGP